MITKRTAAATAISVAMLVSVAGTASAHPDDSGLDDGTDDVGSVELTLPWGDDEKAHDEPTGEPGLPDTVGATGSQTLVVAGRGERNVVGATTDVWAHDGYAYTGTFNSPCGGVPEAGVWVWDVRNKNRPEFVDVIESPAGSRVNDVRAATMNSGDILVHSNEACAGGPGGFEIYGVDDPRNPVLLASVRIDEINPISNSLFGGLTDVGVHNLYLFTQGTNDYVALVSEGAFDNFRVYDITNPSAPTMAAAWGAEELFDPGVGEETANVDRVLAAALGLVGGGFGASANKFLHDITVSADGNLAYLANWDAGLVLLDISDLSDLSVVSVALDPANGSLDGEVNSHSVWPNEDGTIVIEGEEDFSAWEGSVPPSNVTFANLNPIPGVMGSTSIGDAFEASQTGNSGQLYADHVVVVTGPLSGTYPAAELLGNDHPLGTGSVAGPMVWAGRACNSDALLNSSVLVGAIAIVRRGSCTFAEKSQNVAAAGASAIVIANNQPSTPWSGFRIWDYSNPANPVLASTFNTVCSASLAPSPSCIAGGTYSSHNVIVETTDDGRVLAYIAWYNDGMVVLDITDPYNPVELARYLGTNEDGVLNDFWGVYKIQDEPWIYAADRNGGLYIFQLRGQGLQKRGG